MKIKNYIVPILLAVVAGFLMSQILYQQYDKKEKLGTTFKNSSEVSFLQQGVYSSKDSMEQNLGDFPYYIYREEAGKFYVYVAMTKSEENVSKLEGYFKELGYDTYVKKFNISNQAFLEALTQYDLLLQKTSEKGTIKTVCSQVLAKYEELVHNDNQGTTGS